jgi:hypothetical protein
MLDEARKELDERMWPVRMRDPRAEPDDGVENYLTQAEELARSVRVAATREKIEMLEGAKRGIAALKAGESEEYDDDDDDEDF